MRLGRLSRSMPPAAAALRASLLTMAMACASAVALGAESPPPAPPPPASAAAAPTPSLYDVVVDLGRNETMQRELMVTLRETSGWKAHADSLEDPALATELQALEAGRDSLSRARYIELVDADTRIRERVRGVNDATATLGKLAQKLEAGLERLNRMTAQWPQRIKVARELEAPAEIQRRLEAAGPGLAALRDRVRARRDELLVAYDRGIALQTRLDSVRAAIAERRERISADLRTVEDAPIWRQGAVAFPRDEAIAVLRFAHLELVDYLRQHGAHLAAWFVFFTLLVFFALRRQRIAGRPHGSEALDAAGIPAAGALLCALTFIAVLAPRGPFVFYRLVWLATPLLAAVIATKSFTRPIPATTWTLAMAVFINELRIVAEMSPGSDRLVLAVQLLPFAAALVHDWRRGGLARFLPQWPPIRVRVLVRIVLTAIAVTVGASVLGYSGFARALSALVVMAPGIAMAFAATAWTLDQAFAGLLATPVAQSFRSVRERPGVILRSLHRIVVLFCWIAGTLAFMLSQSALDDLLRAGNFVVAASVTVGDVTIAFSAILSALLVVAVTWIVTKFVRFVLDTEILPRLDLRTGVPIAISTIVGYALVVTGFVLATAALGIDLTKVTLLAGALGVGVGLGLQSVVNNFASGLILMIERPINVGDQIDIGGVLGEVRRIGVRSSTIRTPQGAEVIVPNSELATRQVTNWTLSDRARRYEIDVGVAYGTDPARVLRLLEGAVADLPEVQRVPPPRALFTGFGDSSLDFRLFAWVESVDIGVQAQNSMRVAVLRTLDEAGIVIPFPQRDLHIRYAAPAA